MKIKHLLIPVVAVLLCVNGYAAETSKTEKAKKGEVVKQEFKNHFKFYGFIRNFFAFDTRESVAGTGDLFYWTPKDVNIKDKDGVDLNQQNSFRFLALTSRVGVDVYGYQVGKTKFGAKVEADFYSGLSGVTGTAALRLRQAYATVAWEDLPLSGDNKAKVQLKVGQAWHPMAADQPAVFALETGAPFGPFSRTPQVTMDAALGKHFTITAAAIWQMQYTSSGPSGASANYIKYSCTPEIYAGVSVKAGGFLARLGVDILSIKPQNSAVFKGKTVKVADRLTTFSPFMYLQYKYKSFKVNAKTVYGQAGEHYGLMSGYGLTQDVSLIDGKYRAQYAPLTNTSSWVSLSIGTKVQGQLFVGYMKNLGNLHGDFKPIDGVKGYTDASNVYFHKNGSSNINQMYRITPSILYNIGKFSLGLEYAITSTQYGDYAEKAGVKALNLYGLAVDNKHWVTNHRVQMLFKFTF